MNNKEFLKEGGGDLTLWFCKCCWFGELEPFC